MQVEIAPTERLLIVRVKEPRLDSSLALELQALIEEWTAAGFRQVILDLAAVDFIDSTILGVIVQWFKRLRTGQQGDAGTGGGDLVICNIGFKVRSLLQLTRMDRVFTLYEDDSEALRAMTDAPW